MTKEVDKIETTANSMDEILDEEEELLKRLTTYLNKNNI